MSDNDHNDPIKEILTKIGLPASSTTVFNQTTRTVIQQNLNRFYQEYNNSKAFTLPENQSQFLQAIFSITKQMPFMAEKLVEYQSFKDAIITMITRGTWKNY